MKCLSIIVIASNIYRLKTFFFLLFFFCCKVVYEIYQRFKEDWFVEVVFDDLMDWNTWFWEHRRLQPLGIICLGSDPVKVCVREREGWERERCVCLAAEFSFH